MIQHPFINRDHELIFLNKQNTQSDPSFVILYGRRRVGKTEQIRQFTQNSFFLGKYN